MALSRSRLVLLGTFLLATTAVPASAGEPTTFRFESVVSLDDMRDLIRREVGTSSTKDDMRRIFVTEGGATLIAHPASPGSEKYVYDINLCQLYVWRWNISADYAASGQLREIFVNGEPVLDPSATDPLMQSILEDAKKGDAGVYMMQRPRPEAAKGENSLGYVLIDKDADPRTTSDQILAGAGPTRADPQNLGKLHGYTVLPWRSIFDADAVPIMPFDGKCP